MNATEINQYKNVFNKKYGILSSKKNVELKLRYIDKLISESTPTYIFLIYNLIKDQNPAVRAKATDAIIYFFDKLKTQDELYSSLKYLEIKKSDLEYYKKEFSPEIYKKLLGISCFNSNGYVREQAVKNLGQIEDGMVIKFLLMRLSDWVPVVRDSATIALRKFFKSNFKESFISNLEIVQNLINIRRTDLKCIQNEIFTFVYSDISLDSIKSFNDKIRLVYFRNLLQLQRPANNQIIDVVLSDRNYLIRSLLFRDIVQYGQATRKYIIKHALKDSSARIRLNAMFVVNEFANEFSDEILSLISDVSATIRYIARKLLNKNKSDFRTIYLNNIANERNLLGNLLGLSDLIEKGDIAIYENYISHPSPKIRLSSLVAINRIDNTKACDYAKVLLSDPNAKIRNKTAEILSQYTDKETIDYLRGEYKVGNFETKKIILSIYSKIGGYSVIGELINALQENDVRLINQAWNCIFRWSVQASSLYSTPDKADMERAKNLYSTVDKNKRNFDFYQKKVWEDLPFFLR